MDPLSLGPNTYPSLLTIIWPWFVCCKILARREACVVTHCLEGLWGLSQVETVSPSGQCEGARNPLSPVHRGSNLFAVGVAHLAMVVVWGCGARLHAQARPYELLRNWLFVSQCSLHTIL